MNAAVLAAERGFAVFPCRPNDKRPAVDKWEQRACTDRQRVSDFWPAGHNIGIACGPSNLVVIDLDTHDPLPDEWQLPGLVDGKDVFVWICEMAGMDFPRDTYIVQTPSLGWHLYFWAPEDGSFRNKAGNTPIGPSVDIRAGGGYVIGAGSVIDGKEYEILYDQPVQPLPPWIARMIAWEEPDRKPDRIDSFDDGTKRIQGLLRTMEQAKPGSRNHTLFWAACRMAAESPGDMELLATAAAAAGLGDREIRQTITSAQRTAAR